MAQNDDQDEATPESHDELLASPRPKAAPRKYTVDYTVVLILLYWHLGGLHGAYLFFAKAKWATILFRIVCTAMTAWGVTAGTHRLWAHRTYKAKLPLQILLMLLQTMAIQKTVINWARDHRLHHKYCDTDADPHNSTRGFFYCHIGWLMVKKHPDCIKKGREIDLSDLMNNPVLQFQKKFTCCSYDGQTEHINVNEVRKDLFDSKNKLVTSLPPTSAALYKHALRAAYQAGHIRRNALKTEISIPCPSSWGWTKEKESWTPEWSAVTAIWSQLSLLDHCGCKSGYETMRCGCRRVSLPCTAQCKSCKGGCTNQKYYHILVSILVILQHIIPAVFWGESIRNAHFLFLYTLVLSAHTTFSVNSVAHLFGTKPYDKTITPTNNTTLSIFAFGEGYHNYHHVFPFDYRVSELGNNSLNYSTNFIDFFAKIGWAYDLRCATPEMIEKRAKRSGDGTDLWGKEIEDFVNAKENNKNVYRHLAIGQ